MSIWVGKNQMYAKAKSLKDYEAKLKRTSADKSFRLQVFKSAKKHFRNWGTSTSLTEFCQYSQDELGFFLKRPHRSSIETPVYIKDFSTDTTSHIR